MSTLLARLGRGTCLAVLVALAPAGASASLSGAYLAAMQADFRNDYAAAAEYVDQALVSDPDNPGLLQNAIVAHVAEGDVARGGELAERMLKIVPDHHLAVVVRLAGQIAAEEWDAAGETLKTAGPALNPLLSGLLTGWLAVGREDYDGAFAAFDAMTGNEALVAYGQYHKALALALAGDFNQAATILQGDANGPLHLNLGAVVARVQILAQIDRADEARAILDAALADGTPNAVLIDLRRRLEAGQEVGFTEVGDARGGAAEAFLTLADALDTPETERLALLHARLAAHIDPGEVEARLVASEILDREGQPKLAAAALADVSADSPWFVTSEIRRAATQRAAGDAAGGIATLEALRATHPQEIEVHSALGDALRIAERFPEAAAAYDGAIALADPPQPIHWVLFYTRGIAREAGCSSGVLAHYFADKAELMASAMQAAHAEVRARLDHRLTGLASVRQYVLECLPLDERRRFLAELAGERRTMVFFESVHRLAESLAAMAEAFGADRPAALCRELTKTYEEVRRGTLAELAEGAGDVRGEVTLVVAGRRDDPIPVDDAALAAEVAELVAGGRTRRDAVDEVAARHGVARRRVYTLAH